MLDSKQQLGSFYWNERSKTLLGSASQEKKATVTKQIQEMIAAC
jgi:hypothetical protein